MHSNLDDAPSLTDAFFDEAEYFDGDRFIRRGRGRPKSPAPKEQISVRLDPDVVAKLREAGPGWQSQINVLLRQTLGLKDAPARAAAP
ncbi:BrnA antitoxin family protein [Rhodopila sp.]|uniref:BrnA antitoxin family protein n=1 Tax=Rhodopila sp. TaxID=2480087 RepID=UPI003D111295